MVQRKTTEDLNFSAGLSLRTRVERCGFSAGVVILGSRAEVILRLRDFLADA
jgi:hypothetical protein